MNAVWKLLWNGTKHATLHHFLDYSLAFYISVDEDSWSICRPYQSGQSQCSCTFLQPFSPLAAVSGWWTAPLQDFRSVCSGTFSSQMPRQLSPEHLPKFSLNQNNKIKHLSVTHNHRIPGRILSSQNRNTLQQAEF